MKLCTSIFVDARRAIHSFKSDERGFALSFAVVLVPVLIFAIGLVIDIGFAMQERAKAQGAADFAAIAGAEILGTQGYNLIDAQNTAYAIAEANGYPKSNTTVDADYPWSSTFNPNVGSFANSSVNSDPFVLEVRISKDKTNIFGSIFNYLTTTIGVRAVANYGPVSPCIVILDTFNVPANNSGLKVAGSNSSLITHCGIYINSSDTGNGAISVISGSVCGSPLSTPPGYGIINVNRGINSNTSNVCPQMTVNKNVGKTVVNPYNNSFAALNASWPLAASLPTGQVYFTVSGRVPKTLAGIWTDGTVYDTSRGGRSAPACGAGNSGCIVTYDVYGGSFPNGINIGRGGGSPSVTRVIFHKESDAGITSVYNVANTGVSLAVDDTTFEANTYYFANVSPSTPSFNIGGGLTTMSGGSEFFLSAAGLDIDSASVVNANTGAGVILALTNPNNGTVNVSGTGSAFNLNAPTSATASGFPANFAVVQNTQTVTGSQGINGGAQAGAVFNVNGLVVMPYTNLILSSGGQNANYCAGYVVWTLSILGGAAATDGCQVTNQNTAGLKSALLFE